MDAAAEAPTRPSTPSRISGTGSSKRKERPASCGGGGGGNVYHVTAFGGEPVPDPCTPQTRRWILLFLVLVLAIDFTFYVVVTRDGSGGSAADASANIGGLLCLPTALALFFVLSDLCRGEQTAMPLQEPLLVETAQGDKVQVMVVKGEKPAKAIGVDSLRKLAMANQLKASL